MPSSGWSVRLSIVTAHLLCDSSRQTACLVSGSTSSATVSAGRHASCWVAAFCRLKECCLAVSAVCVQVLPKALAVCEAGVVARPTLWMGSSVLEAASVASARRSRHRRP